MKFFLFLLIMTAAIHVMAQEDSAQNLYFVRKGRELSFGKPDFQPGKYAFYLYRNCVYDLVLLNGKQLSARIVDIRRDSIYYIPYNNGSAVAGVLSVHPSSLKKIRMIGDRLMGLYSGYSLRGCRYVFEKTTTPKMFKAVMDTVYSVNRSHSTVYEVVPYLTAQGIDHLYKQCGITYYYEGIGQPACEDTVKRPFIEKRGIWFTPSNANRIRGLNIGILTMSFGSGDSLSVHGVNLNVDLLSGFLSIVGVLYVPFGNSLINMEDTIALPSKRDSVIGLSISGGGLSGLTLVKGVSINGGVCFVSEARGIVITGTQSLTDDFKGVVISGLRNRAIRGRGVQVGLLNICKHLKGVQVGLWNVNSKRKLPFINWSF